MDDPQDRPLFKTLMQALAATFRVEVTAALEVGYWLGLHDMPIKVVQQAIGRAMASCRFMPVPRELRDLAGVMGADQRAIIAWNVVKCAIREQGAYRSVRFDDGAINAAIRSLGGWPRVCSTESEELDKWTSKEFQRLYRELSALPLGQDLTKYLPGIFESSGDLTEKRPAEEIAVGTGGGQLERPAPPVLVAVRP